MHSGPQMVGPILMLFRARNMMDVIRVSLIHSGPEGSVSVCVYSTNGSSRRKSFEQREFLPINLLMQDIEIDLETLRKILLDEDSF